MCNSIVIISFYQPIFWELFISQPHCYSNNGRICQSWLCPHAHSWTTNPNWDSLSFFSKSWNQISKLHKPRCWGKSDSGWEMQIKTTVRCITSHQSEWPSSKSLQTIKAGEGVEKREPSCIFGGNVNGYSHQGRQYGDSLKDYEWNHHMTQQSHCWAHTPRKQELIETRIPQCSLQHCLQ